MSPVLGSSGNQCVDISPPSFVININDKKKDEEPTSANIKLLVFVSAIAGVALIVYFL